jgi:hypothetical protein
MTITSRETQSPAENVQLMEIIVDRKKHAASISPRSGQQRGSGRGWHDRGTA